MMRSLGIWPVLFLAACATTPGSPNLDKAEPDLGVVAFSAAQIDPSVKLSAGFRGKGDAAAKAAGAGVLECMSVLIPADPLAIILAPLCVVIGAPVGAALGASSGASLVTVEEAERALQAQIATSAPQRQLLHYASEYAKASGLNGIVVLPVGKPTTVDAPPSYSVRESGHTDTVLEMTLIEIAASTPGVEKLDYQFALTARGRLIRVQDNTVLDAFERCAATDKYTYEEWRANDAELFKDQIAEAARELVEGFIDKWLLVYRGPVATTEIRTETPSGTPEDRTDDTVLAEDEVGVVSPYALWPSYRAQEYRRSNLVAQESFRYGPVIASDKLSPTLRWEPVPRSFKRASGKQDNQISSIVYDLRLYEPSPYEIHRLLGMQLEFWKAGLAVGSWSGLTSSEFTPDVPLKPCTRYHWTVRARFTLNGRVRTTEWGSSLVEGVPRGWRWRYRGPRPYVSCPERRIYFPFITPNADGTICN